MLFVTRNEGTEEYDREGKFEAYQQIPSLREYVLVSTRERLIEVFRRSAEGAWLRTEARTHGSLRLESIDCGLGVDAIYEGVDVDRANTYGAPFGQRSASGSVACRSPAGRAPGPGPSSARAQRPTEASRTSAGAEQVLHPLQNPQGHSQAAEVGTIERRAKGVLDGNGIIEIHRPIRIELQEEQVLSRGDRQRNAPQVEDRCSLHGRLEE